uniref:Uncharacterized protein n=1 Tax=Anopheles melas TaxID=34690 RepID=A0A182TH10_9DIPT
MSVAAAAREQSDVLTQLNELWRSIEQEIRSHRHEQERTRTVLQEQLERVQSQAPDKLAAETVAEPDYKRVSDEVIRNQQNQIQLIKEVQQKRETEALTKAIDELRTGECQLRTELERTMRDKSELETLLDTAAALARQHMSRENLALAKVQEALQIADSAIEEKNCVVRREQDAREECDFLASTIGQVMEEAARKVEHELGGLRSGYERRIGELERALDQTRSTLETQVQRTSQAETRARTVEEKFRALLKTNQNLDTDLRAASKMIVEHVWLWIG